MSRRTARSPGSRAGRGGATVHPVVSPAGREAVARASRLTSRSLEAIRELGGGGHATVVLVADGGSELVVRAFPAGDEAVGHEVQVLPRIEALGDRVPRLVAHAVHGAEPPLIVTTRVRGAHPPAWLAPEVIAQQMAGVLADIHRLPGDGLRPTPAGPPAGPHPVAVAARRELPALLTEERVLTHYDFWCGNALWDGDVLTGVVDWSGARHGPRGLDVAWCRQDLVLLGSARAADLFLHEYERAAGRHLPEIRAWDTYAAAQAVACVEDWAPNYHGIDRPDITRATLRRRLDAWVRRLLRDSSS